MSATASPRIVPPHVPPASSSFGSLTLLRRLISNNLSIIPAAAYEEPVAVVRGPPRLTFVTGENAVKTLLQSRDGTFPKGRLQNEVLEPLFGNAMISSEGADWRWQRGAAAPLFRHQELLRYGPIMTGAAEAVIDTWRHADPDEPRLVNRDMMKAAFGVISRTMLAGGADDVLAAIEKGHAEYFRYVNWWVANRLLGLPRRLPRPGGRAMRAQERKIRSAVRELVEARRHAGGEGDDLLARLLDARDPETGQQMDTERLVCNLVAFLVAGYDTTALALAWSLYLVACSPEWADAIRDEVETVCGDTAAGSEHFDRLTMTRQVVSESLRLYPTAPIIVRDVTRDVEVEDMKLRAGSIVFVPIYAIHRHRAYWRDPDAFNPARFSPESPKPSKYSYLPFGIGPRICIGAAFAQLEITVMLANFVRHAEFRLAEPAPRPAGQMFLTARDGIRMYVRTRRV